MKKILIAFLLLFSLSSLFALSDKEEIENALTVYQNALNEKDVETIKSIVSNPEKTEKLFEVIANGPQYIYHYEITVLNVSVEGNAATVDTSAKCTTDFSNIESLKDMKPITLDYPHTFAFVKRKGKWLLIY